VDVEYKSGEKLLFINDDKEPAIKIFEAKTGKWLGCDVDWKVGYSSNYSLEFTSAFDMSFVLPNGNSSAKSNGNVFLSLEHVMKIDEAHGKGDFIEFNETKQVSEDLDEITAAMIEDLNQLLEAQLDAILEFSVSQESDGESPYDTKMKTPSDTINTAKGKLPKANEEECKRLELDITEQMVNWDPSPIVGFQTKIEQSQNHDLSCLTYLIEIIVKSIGSPTEVDAKPVVGLKDAVLNSYDGTLEGEIISGHPKLSNGTYVSTSSILGFIFDKQRTARVETLNTIYVVEKNGWLARQSPHGLNKYQGITPPPSEDDRRIIIQFSFPNIPSPGATNLWFWKRLITSLGKSSEHKLIDASEQNPIEELKGWLLKISDIKLLGKEFEGFVNYLMDERLIDDDEM